MAKIISSPWNEPELVIPEVALIDLLLKDVEESVRENGDAIWLHDYTTGDKISYSQIIPSVRAMSSAITKMGFKKGDMMIMYTSNHALYFITILSAWKCGGGVTLSNQFAPVEAICRQQARTGARFVVCNDVTAANTLEVQKRCPDIKEIFCLGKSEGCHSVADLIQDDGSAYPTNVQQDYDDIIYVPFAPGTGSHLNGVCHTNRSLVACIYTMRSKKATIGLNVIYSAWLFHLGTIETVLSGLKNLHTNITLSVFSEDNLFKAISELKPEIAFLNQPQVATIAKSDVAARHQLDSIRCIISGGQYIPPEVERSVREKLVNLKTFCKGYGMSEYPHGAITAPLGNHVFDLSAMTEETVDKPGCVGRPCPFTEIKVIDSDTGDMLGPNTPGEICFRGPYMFKQYWNDPENSEIFQLSRFHNGWILNSFAKNDKNTQRMKNDGWVHSGDLGYYDEEDNLYFIERLKEVIKYNVFPVMPDVVEKIIVSHPTVDDAAVVGLPSLQHGELPTAFIVKRKGHENITEDEILDFVNSKVADYEKIRGGVFFIDRIPRLLGRVNRRELRSKAIARTEDKLKQSSR